MQKEPKVLLVTSRLSVGGVAKSTCMLANSLSNSGKKVEILRFSDEQVKYNLNKDIKITTVTGPDSIAIQTNSIIRRFLSLWFNIRVFIVLFVKRKELIIAFRTDIVRIVIRYKSLLGLNVIGSERGNPYRFNEEQLKEISRTYSLCNCVVFQTKESQKCFPQIANKSVVIPNYCIVESFPCQPIVHRKKEIVACGVHSEDKGFDLLIEAFSQVYISHPDYKLCLYGPINQYSIYLKNLVEKYNLSKCVCFKGVVDCFYKESYNSAMYVLSSRNEGIPNTLIEALYAGIPSIATNCTSGGPSLLLDAGRNGLLIPVGSVEKLKEAIITYIENPKLAEEYGLKGKSGLERFSEKNITKKWVDVIDNYER